MSDFSSFHEKISRFRDSVRYASENAFTNDENGKSQNFTSNSVDRQKKNTNRKSQSKTKENIGDVQRFPFNPNNISFEQWRKLGVPERVIHTIMNYKEAGGYFKCKEDLKKIYGLTDALYEKLAAYITLPKADSNKERFNSAQPELQVEINSIDSVALQKIHGIGPVLSKRIVKYRYLLGGFVSKKQLKEIYGLSDKLFADIKNQVKIDSGAISFINVNNVTEEVLLRHPYISDYEVRAFLKYRKYIESDIQSIREIKQNNVISPKAFHKIKPYLTVK